LPFSERTLAIRVTQDGIGETTNAIEGLQQSLGGLKTKAGLAAGAIGAIGFAAATKSASDFESSLADVEKVTSESTMEGLKDDIRTLNTELPITRKDLTKLAEQAGKFGVEGEENIANFVETVGKLSLATDLEAGELGKRFAKIAGQTDTPISKIQKLGDVSNSLADSMKTDNAEISDAVVRSSNTLSGRLGLSTERVFALSASMNEASASSRRASGGLRRAAEALLNPKKAADIAEALGMTTEEFRTMRNEEPARLFRTVTEAMDGNSKQSTKLASVLGKRPTRAFTRLNDQLGRTDKALQTANKQMEEGGSVAREVGIRSDTAAFKFGQLKGEIQNAAETTGQNFLPIVKLTIDTLSDLVSKFNTLNRNTDGFAGTVVITSAIVVGLIATLGVLATVITATVIPGLVSLGATMGTVAGLIFSPITAVLLFIAVLGALATNVGNFRDKVVAGFLGMGFGVNNAVRAMANAVMSIWNEMVRFTIQQTKEFLAAAQKIVNAINKIRKARGKDPIQPIAAGLEASTFQEDEKFDILGEEEMNAMLDRAAEKGFISEEGRRSGSDTEGGLLGATGKTFGDVFAGTGEGLLDAAGIDMDELFQEAEKKAEKRAKKARKKAKKQAEKRREKARQRFQERTGTGGATTDGESGTVSAFGGLPGPLGGLLSGDVTGPRDLLDRSAAAPSESVSGGDISASASDIGRAVERAIDGATLRLEGDDISTDATVETTGTEQTRRESRLGNRSVNL
jgi:TP901 family phage tail tape measure protein